MGVAETRSEREARQNKGRDFASRERLDRIAEIKRRREEIEKTRPQLNRGDRVVVHQAGITDYAGTVSSVKYSGPTQTWWLEVRLDHDGMTWSVPAQSVVKEVS